MNFKGEFIEITKFDSSYLYEDCLVFTDNNEIHVGYFDPTGFVKFTNDGWSGRITHFALLINILLNK